MPTLLGLAGVPEAQAREAAKGLPGRDFSGVLAHAETAAPQAVRPGVLFNYVAPLTIDSDYCLSAMTQLLQGQVAPPLMELQPKLDKRGFLSFVFDGRYKFARYYAPANFNTPEALEQILRDNDIQLFDLKNDPLEAHNLVLDVEKEQGSDLAHERVAKRTYGQGSWQKRWWLPASLDPSEAALTVTRETFCAICGHGEAAPTEARHAPCNNGSFSRASLIVRARA
jgi:hypothetical protein